MLITNIKNFDVTYHFEGTKQISLNNALLNHFKVFRLRSFKFCGISQSFPSIGYQICAV